MKILLIGNYANDRQESMQRFAGLLERGLQARGHSVARIRPRARLGALWPAARGLGKWLGYADKFMLFPRAMRAMAAWADVIHICDHSNAFYTPHLAGRRVVVTCHDLLAVRGALGEDTDCPASLTGKMLQRWILNGLRRARAVACVSSYTRRDVERLIGKGPRIRVVLNGLNHGYRVLPAEEAASRLACVRQLDLSRPYVLHVGSSQRRKNREGVIRIFGRIKDEWNGQLVFAGQALSSEQIHWIKTLGLQSRVVHAGSPSNDLLEALYNQAHALLFPSTFEGFGWPIIEAQACGCPVVCSDRCSFPEVCGQGAYLRDAGDEAGFAADLMRLCVPLERRRLTQRGFDNIKRFAADTMLDNYVRLYEDEMAAPCCN